MPASPGALRFNTDSNKLELYDGNQWTEIVASSPDSQTGGARGVFGGGLNPGLSPATQNVIQYINISSTGNAQDFGDLTVNRYGNSACSSNTRGLWSGGINPATIYNTIDYVTISSTGNALDFGDLLGVIFYSASVSNSTRGICGGGSNPGIQNVLQYVTIASTGNAVDFGDLTFYHTSFGSCASPTRGIFAGGNTPTAVNTIQYITIASLGNAADFGDLTVARFYVAGCSNATRGVFGGGYVSPGSPGTTPTIDYIQISTLGNAVTFGNLTVSRREIGALSSSTRGVFAGAWVPLTNTIDYVTINTQGDAIDFGDLTISTLLQEAGLSNGHGGL